MVQRAKQMPTKAGPRRSVRLRVSVWAVLIMLIAAYGGAVIGENGLMAAVAEAADHGGADASLKRGAGGDLFDGGGFPTATETPTATVTATQVVIPPTETVVAAYPAPADKAPDLDQLQAAQAAPAQQTSPSLSMLCLPFGIAGILLIAVLANRLRRMGQGP